MQRTGAVRGVSGGLSEPSMKPSNQPLQPSGTRLQAGAARRAGSCHRLNGGVRLHTASEAS